MGNLSGRQQGIQSGHAALEYVAKYKDYTDVWNFITDHKTFIMLDGGGSDDMKTHKDNLNSLGIHTAEFHEPDLNDSMSAIAFLIPEEVYGIDLKDPGWNEPGDWAYDVKEYLSGFRLASN